MLYVLAVRDISIDEVNGIIRIDVVSPSNTRLLGNSGT